MLASRNSGVKAYNNVGVASTIPYSDSMQLIQMLFGGLIETLAVAEGQFIRKDVEGRALSVERALKILGGLQSSLNFEDGKELARNLSDIYDYCSRQLLKASLDHDAKKVSDIRSLIAEINDAWQSLPKSLNQRSIPMAS